MVIMLVMMTMILTLLSRNHFCDNEKYDDGDDTNNDGGDVQNDDSGCGSSGHSEGDGGSNDEGFQCDPMVSVTDGRKNWRSKTSSKIEVILMFLTLLTPSVNTIHMK